MVDPAELLSKDFPFIYDHRLQCFFSDHFLAPFSVSVSFVKTDLTLPGTDLTVSGTSSTVS